jgi:alpha-N-acetylglucosaminidase
MQGQWLLQTQILKLTRSLGIIGVLPAFQGNMPPQIKKMYPQANISTTHAGRPGGDNITKGDCAWVASTDQLFGLVADAWMQTLIADFGTDNWYQCDGFFTGAKPPWLNAAAAREQDAMVADAVAIGPVQPDPNWTPVWKAAWEGMARTDPHAKWLYQGWAIRGWDDAAGASRIRALYEAVPKGQWIPLDMDVSGIWRYFGNYSFFGAPFIWTTLHNMGGNDGLKGDMRLLQRMPSDAVAAGASIIGTGSTPEGIDQNPAYYEYAFDTAWSQEEQSLNSWFAAFATRRYGVANEDAEAAWCILSTAVYTSEAGGWHDNTGVEWDLGVPSATGFATAEAFKAWQLLVKAGATIDPHTCAPLNYDIVNVGREVLAQLITAFELNLTAAVAQHDRAGALSTAATLLQAYTDLDTLLECDYGFLLGPWIAQARRFANATDAPASYYEWQARSQVSTWWPVAPSARDDPATFKKFPTLDNYANKHWNGLVRDFYAKRVQCFVNQVTVDLTTTATLNTTNITKCAVTAELDFTQDTTTKYAEVAASDQTLSISLSLVSRYGAYLQ